MTSRALANGLVRSVAIVGGTHGNEKSGVLLVQHLQHLLENGPRLNFKTSFVLANKRAIKANTRYVDKDLNRCFLLKDLEKEHSLEDPPLAWEELRAQQLNSIMGPKGSANPKVDFIIDLHNTTSNTGVALMMDARDDFSHEMAAYLQTHESAVRVCNWSTDADDHAMLPTVSRSGLTFEVGPTPWGVVNTFQLQRSKRLIVRALQYIHARNAQFLTTPTNQQSLMGHLATNKKQDYMSQRAISSASQQLAADEVSSRWANDTMWVYRRATNIGYPADRGSGPMLIHPQMQDKDFTPLAIGDPVFVDIDGKNVIPFAPTHPFWAAQKDFPGFEEPLYPFFINEAAYYEKDIAFVLAKKIARPVQLLKAAASPSSSL